MGLGTASSAWRQLQLQELRQMLNDVRETTPEEMRQIRQASQLRAPEPVTTAAPEAVDDMVQERGEGWDFWRRWAVGDNFHG